jgi:hypothetical protein
MGRRKTQNMALNNRMTFGYITLATALIISLSAAVYSILGLTAIFAAAFWPIVIMGGSLEVGKIIATLWLHKYWDRAELQYKAYLCFAVAILMMLTSMGVFGFLSKAHGDQSLVAGDVGAKIAVYDEKIKIEKDNIDANRKALKQMDEAVDQVMARSTTEGGADKAVSIRRSQAKERSRLLQEITQAQKNITNFNEARAPIAAEVRQVEAEVGPVKYIAALIYGDNPEANVLEKAVRWVIILIVIVFDPLALTLLLAATKSLEWERGIDIFNINKKKEEEEEEAEEKEPEGDIPVFDREEIPVEEPILEEPKKLWAGFGFPMSSIFDKKEEPVAEKVVVEEPVIEEVAIEEPAVVIATPATIVDEDPIVKLAKQMYAADHPDEDLDAHHEAHANGEISTLPWHRADHLAGLPISDGERKRLLETMSLQPDNVPKALGTVTGFGTSFPTTANKGDLFLRVDALPTILYKFNGVQWIEVDKSLTDSYVYDDAYITHLIDKIGAGEYDPDLLSDAEREQIALKLKDSPSLG